MNTSLTPLSKNLLVVVFSIAGLIRTAHAQYKERYIPIGYVGVEISGGTRLFNLSSDIAELNQLKVTEEGVNVSLFAGNEVAIGKLKYGFYQSGRLVREKVKMQEGELAINVFPLYIFDVKSKLVKPYALVSFELNNLQFFGNYNLPKPVVMPGQSSDCNCLDHPELPECSGEVIPDEPIDEGQTTDLKEERLLGNIVVSKFDVGAGVMVHIPRRNKFLNLFAEVKYGLPVGVKAKDQAFKNSKVSTFTIVNVGINFGIRH
jgi:hypothetical protein